VADLDLGASPPPSSTDICATKRQAVFFCAATFVNICGKLFFCAAAFVNVCGKLFLRSQALEHPQ
jgi:hypothetical protein